MINYRCFNCDHECRLDSGSMFGPPTKCVVTGKVVEWAKVLDISQNIDPPNKVNSTEANNCGFCNEEGMRRSPGGWYKCGCGKWLR